MAVFFGQSSYSFVMDNANRLYNIQISVTDYETVLICYRKLISDHQRCAFFNRKRLFFASQKRCQALCGIFNFPAGRMSILLNEIQCEQWKEKQRRPDHQSSKSFLSILSQ